MVGIGFDLEGGVGDVVLVLEDASGLIEDGVRIGCAQLLLILIRSVNKS